MRLGAQFKIPNSKLLIRTASAVRHNICIPDAQYYELSALRNLWCEILEF